MTSERLSKALVWRSDSRVGRAELARVLELLTAAKRSFVPDDPDIRHLVELLDRVGEGDRAQIERDFSQSRDEPVDAVWMTNQDARRSELVANRCVLLRRGLLEAGRTAICPKPSRPGRRLPLDGYAKRGVSNPSRNALSWMSGRVRQPLTQRVVRCAVGGASCQIHGDLARRLAAAVERIRKPRQGHRGRVAGCARRQGDSRARTRCGSRRAVCPGHRHRAALGRGRAAAAPCRRPSAELANLRLDDTDWEVAISDVLHA